LREEVAEVRQEVYEAKEVGWEVEIEVVEVFGVQAKMRLGVDRSGVGEEVVAFR
jgi:hypothetical protein